MKTLRFLFIALLFSQKIIGQALKVTPEFPTTTGEITLTFDLTQAKDNRKAGLLGQSSGLYLWAWGGSSLDDKKTADISPAGQTTWTAAFAPGLLTRVSENVWTIKLTPSKYFSIPTGKSLKWLGCLVKNTTGTAQTEDFVFDLFEANKLVVKFEKPVQKNFYVETNTTLPVKVKASAKADMKLTLDGTTIATANDTTLTANISTGSTPDTKRIVKLTAMANNAEITDEFSFTTAPISKVEALPTGLRNGINYTSTSSATLVLHAPQKKFVYAVGDFNNWTADANSLMKRTPDGQTYWLAINNLTPQKEYAYQYWIEGSIGVADPYSEKILDRNNDQSITAAVYPNMMPYPAKALGNTASVLQSNQTKYIWKTTNFKRPAADNLVIYELHIRDFVGNQHIKSVMDSIPYLKRLGVNAIELMPIMEFTGNDSWGYNPTFFMAPDKAYGTPDDLKKFIDKCHENGMAVILDMVLNHADYEFPYVKMYWDGTQPAGDSPFFNTSATHPYSVFFDFNHESTATRGYVDRVNEFWLKEYNFDGYRFDLSKGFTQKNTGTNVGAWGGYDKSRIDNIKRMYDQIRKVDASAYVILEHFADDSEEAELTNYGMMVWDNQNGGIRSLAKNGTGDFSRLSWRNHAGFTKPAIIGFMESHDEERIVFDAIKNGSSADGYNVKTLSTAIERVKMLAALTLLIPGPKMIWQFGELGYDVSIDENGRTGRKPIRWHYLQDPDRLKLYKTIAEINKLKTTQDVFRSTDFTIFNRLDIMGMTLNNSSMKVQIVANVTLRGANVGLTVGRWYDYFSGQEINITTSDPIYFLQPGQFHILTSNPLPAPEKGLVNWSLSLPTSVDLPKTELELSPNPASNFLKIEWNSKFRGLAMVEIQNVMGQSVQKVALNKIENRIGHTLDVSKLPIGSYFLKVIENENVMVEKWIKK